MKYKKGDVVNCKWNGPFMRLIGLFNRIKYKQDTARHTGIISKIEGNKIWVHEAIEVPGSDFKAYEYDKGWLDDKIKEGLVTIRRYEKLTNLDEVIKSYEHIKYNWLSIILMPFKLAVDSKNKCFCSEVVARILYDASDKKFNIENDGIKYEKCTPMDLQLTKQLKTIRHEI